MNFLKRYKKNKNSNFYSTLKIMADNGVVLDKFATLATDSFRSLTLELCGYKTKMIEFIEGIKDKIFGKTVGLFGSYDWGTGVFMENWVEQLTSENFSIVHSYKNTAHASWPCYI